LLTLFITRLIYIPYVYILKDVNRKQRCWLLHLQTLWQLIIAAWITWAGNYIFGALAIWASDVQILLCLDVFLLNKCHPPPFTHPLLISHPLPLKCARFLKPSECEKVPVCLHSDHILSKTITYKFIFLKMKIPLAKLGE